VFTTGETMGVRHALHSIALAMAGSEHVTDHRDRPVFHHQLAHRLDCIDRAPRESAVTRATWREAFALYSSSAAFAPCSKRRP
jgi:hypothetical protein